MNVKIDGQSFEVEIHDLHARPVQVTVDGEVFEVWVDEQGEVNAPASTNGKLAVSAPAPQAPAAARPVPSAPAPAANQAKAVLAPIPGVIESISVKEGDSVVFGQELCVLEAMKMKNLIKANRAGKIAAVRVTAGDQVRHSQVLMEYSD